jgi:hypothetical protein
MTDANDLPKKGARITFAGLGSVWFDEAGDLDAEKFDAILADHDVTWIEFGEPRVLSMPFTEYDEPGSFDLPRAIEIPAERMVDEATEKAVREKVAKLSDDKRPAYRRIEFGGRHGGKRPGLRK